jgi:hypothetical protein
MQLAFNNLNKSSAKLIGGYIMPRAIVLVIKKADINSICAAAICGIA